MKLTRRAGLKLMGATALALGPVKAFAQDATVHEVQMLNKHPDSSERQVFFPDIVRAQPGDTIKFIPTDKGHNSEGNGDMLPEGVEAWKGKINEEIDIVVEAEGVYGFHCTPHQSAGMVGVLLVGAVTPEQMEAAKGVRMRGKAKARYEDIFARAEALLAEESA